ncbi:DNA/RNA non-specific endonuclease [Butyrivibrio sp. XPD2002]|uniref:DNA/RNA non-specific endonuclease n=1 Tax=Butyrivibrio sp. XPD2002 TaxID=1280665 RepID=UPI0003F6B08E|nr:DNA/RNA non-specific endonuclease [Butyrivibrio sp. XPD2002]
MRKANKDNFIWLFILVAVIIGACITSGRAYANRKTVGGEIPSYSGSPAITINDNKPEFTKSEITKVSYESYGELDELGRCTPAMACIGKDLMPTKDRESISMVKPTGWEQEKYPGLVDSDPPFLYNRCHMIGFQLTGENANEQNLITGTRYMNVEGMLPYENEVAEYIRSTGNHVMYRVTPVFDGNNLLCDGVKIEALSVEDNGKGVSFNVFCYNVQPGVIIDYTDGSNKLDRNYNADSSSSQNGLTTYSMDEFVGNGTETNTEKNAKKNTENISRSSSEKTYSYIGNRNSHVFHNPDCDSVSDMKEKNKVYFEDATRDEVIGQGFKPCGRCKP